MAPTKETKGVKAKAKAVAKTEAKTNSSLRAAPLKEAHYQNPRGTPVESSLDFYHGQTRYFGSCVCVCVCVSK